MKLLLVRKYDKIVQIALEDEVIDKNEKALLSDLQQMIEDKVMRFAKSKR